jgi:hypothetical protein
MRIRAEDANGDFQFGLSDAQFLVNSSAAVAQAIHSAVLLFQGDYFANLLLGVPWETEVLGYGTGSLYDAALQNVITGVTGVDPNWLSYPNSYSSALNTTTRVLTVNMRVKTIYGGTAILSIPWTPSEPVVPIVPAIFGGIGTAGATSPVTASGITAVLNNSNVLARASLSAETVGETFGPYTPNPTTGSVIYLLLTGAPHTFSDALTGFPFPFNAPIAVSFITSAGAIGMYLYQSTNALFLPVEPKVIS